MMGGSPVQRPFQAFTQAWIDLFPSVSLMARPANWARSHILCHRVRHVAQDVAFFSGSGGYESGQPVDPAVGLDILSHIIPFRVFVFGARADAPVPRRSWGLAPRWLFFFFFFLLFGRVAR